MDPTQARRKTLIENVRVEHYGPEDPLYPHWMFPDGEKLPVWLVWLTTRTGMTPESHSAMTFLSEEEALAFKSRNQVGRELSGFDDAISSDLDNLREYVENQMDSGAGKFLLGPGPDDSPLHLDVLNEAGVKVSYRTSPKVLEYLGDKRIKKLKSLHAENWTCAAEFEYCWLNFPHTSLAYIAAAYQFHYYIIQDDFASGYLLRDLEMLSMGVEAEAIKSFSMRKKAGEAGSKKSAEARSRRVTSLIGNMETIVERNPDISQLGCEAVAKLALDLCIKNEPRLWVQGRGQLNEYLGEIRRGEAGVEVKERFQVLFPSKPPRRF